jgi:hypothetical protein
MELQSVSVEWGTLLAVVLATAAPTITGLLQQFSVKFSEKAPWYLKSFVTAAISALIGVVTSYATQGDTLLGAAGGAIVGGIGAWNIAARKGVGRFFDISLTPKTPPTPPTP